MIRYIQSSFRCLILSTIFLGILYPAVIWLFGMGVFHHSSSGEKVFHQGRCVGLKYVGQKFSSDQWFWSRPSAISSGPLLVSEGSNLSWSDPRLRDSINQRLQDLSKGQPLVVPEDLLMTSASGCDPEISIKAALFQVPRVAAARKITEDSLRSLIFEMEENTFLGLYPRRVNVLLLNCRMDQKFPS